MPMRTDWCSRSARCATSRRNRAVTPALSLALSVILSRQVLAFPRFSLAYLLKHYCDIDADKQYQVADWRIRPLPDEMTHYAREDTHSLLFIYDKLRNELIERGNAHANLLRAVWMQSRDLCLQKYEKPLYRPDGVYRLLEKHNRSFSAKQLAGFKVRRHPALLGSVSFLPQVQAWCATPPPHHCDTATPSLLVGLFAVRFA